MRNTGFVRRWCGWMVMTALLVGPLLPVAAMAAMAAVSAQTVFAAQHEQQ